MNSDRQARAFAVFTPGIPTDRPEHLPYAPGGFSERQARGLAVFIRRIPTDRPEHLPYSSEAFPQIDPLLSYVPKVCRQTGRHMASDIFPQTYAVFTRRIPTDRPEH